MKDRRRRRGMQPRHRLQQRMHLIPPMPNILLVLDYILLAAADTLLPLAIVVIVVVFCRSIFDSHGVVGVVGIIVVSKEATRTTAIAVPTVVTIAVIALLILLGLGLVVIMRISNDGRHQVQSCIHIHVHIHIYHPNIQQRTHTSQIALGRICEVVVST